VKEIERLQVQSTTIDQQRESWKIRALMAEAQLLEAAVKPSKSCDSSCEWRDIHAPSPLAFGADCMLGGVGRASWYSSPPSGWAASKGRTHDCKRPPCCTPNYLRRGPSTHETPRVHHASWQRSGSVATRGKGATAGDAGDWIYQQWVGKSL
jgi:hypothetical protein